MDHTSGCGLGSAIINAGADRIVGMGILSVRGRCEERWYWLLARPYRQLAVACTAMAGGGAPRRFPRSVVSVRDFTASQTMYNSSVADVRTYYVIAGTTLVLVHNCGGDLDEMSASGRRRQKGAKAEFDTQAGYEYDKRMKRRELPRPPGKTSRGAMDEAGGNLLDDILTDPHGKPEPVTGGKFKGGTLIVRPDGVGAVFDPDGASQYFGVGYMYL